MISIIGGAGFIGTNIVNRLGHKYEFKIFDNGFNPSGHIDFDSLEIGTVSHEELKDFLKGSDIVINLAGHTRVLESIEDPNLSFTYNVKGFFDVLMVSKELGIKKVINASSGGAIIGDAVPPIDENFLPNPISPYGASKLCNEAFASAFSGSYGMNIINLRFSNVYGKYCINKQSAVAKFIKQIIRKEKIQVYGDGNQTRDFLFVEDLVDALECCITIDDISGVFQLGSGVPTSVNELLESLIKFSKKNLEISYIPANKGEIENNYANIKKAKDKFGWRPRTSLETGIQKTFDYLSKNVS